MAAMLEHPEFDTQLDFPFQQNAQEIYDQELTQKEDQTLAQLKDKYGFFFFYYGEDPYAVGMAEALQRFADKYSLTLMGVSMDGVGIDVIRDNRVNQGQAEKLGVKAYPAVFMFDPETNDTSPVSYGFMSQDQLATRIYNIVNIYNKEDDNA
jgi:conjugal transfer pilus assembly protein TraF